MALVFPFGNHYNFNIEKLIGISDKAETLAPIVITESDDVINLRNPPTRFPPISQQYLHIFTTPVFTSLSLCLIRACDSFEGLCGTDDLDEPGLGVFVHNL